MEIKKWIDKIINGSTGYRAMDTYEGVVHHVNVETTLADWTIRCLGNPKCEGSLDVIEACAHEHGKVVVDGWTSVENKLPEPETVVLVYIPKDEDLGLRTLAYCYNGVWYHGTKTVLKEFKGEVTHWTPLMPTP